VTPFPTRKTHKNVLVVLLIANKFNQRLVTNYKTK
jgi:hypothetical protein